ncbi:ABC transporter permease subunit [Vibrio parahaemolyticus]|uniref:ABC transporter permease subunit n=1 Tax=Vibrio parahaemolyticus TaxID=670 RepID=UPI00128F53A6|nr:ABC transporter permease subunit [Vibrio parahaemolyticus]MQC32272.1 ABC transporter permease subunit [Vibrio parahaemolyticus]
MSTEQTNNDPWSQTAPTQEDPWSQGSEAATSNDWLSSEAVQETPFDIMNPFLDAVLPLDNWVESGLNWLVEHGRPVFQAIRVPIDFILSSFETALVSTPSPIMVLILFLLAWQFSNFKLGLSTLVSLVFIGLPMGIWLARSQTAAKFVRPILDAMQTTPAFVYLVPIVMLFGIGNVPGVVVTIIFALPPVVRLTILGIQQVPEELIEAGHSFGANKKQMLYRIQLPLALPTIMAGVNQTLMLSLSMVVIASMIAVGGLGQMVLRGIGRLDMGLAAVGGLGIVILAILLDRITQELGVNAGNTKLRWYHTGPISYLLKFKTNKNPNDLKLRRNTNE